RVPAVVVPYGWWRRAGREDAGPLPGDDRSGRVRRRGWHEHVPGQPDRERGRPGRRGGDPEWLTSRPNSRPRTTGGPPHAAPLKRTRRPRPTGTSKRPSRTTRVWSVVRSTTSTTTASTSAVAAELR